MGEMADYHSDPAAEFDLEYAAEKREDKFRLLQALREAEKQTTCPYCGRQATLRAATDVYGPRAANWQSDYVWQCAPCAALVSCHPGTIEPMGTLANAELRQWRRRAHDHFDTWRKRQGIRRSTAYRRLAKRMKLPDCRAHIAMFDVEQCKKVCKYYPFKSHFEVW